jgi:hypothetical protein
MVRPLRIATVSRIVVRQSNAGNENCRLDPVVPAKSRDTAASGFGNIARDEHQNQTLSPGAISDACRCARKGSDDPPPAQTGHGIAGSGRPDRHRANALLESRPRHLSTGARKGLRSRTGRVVAIGRRESPNSVPASAPIPVQWITGIRCRPRIWPRRSGATRAWGTGPHRSSRCSTWVTRTCSPTPTAVSGGRSGCWRARGAPGSSVLIQIWRRPIVPISRFTYGVRLIPA